MGGSTGVEVVAADRPILLRSFGGTSGLGSRMCQGCRRRAGSSGGRFVMAQGEMLDVSDKQTLREAEEFYGNARFVARRREARSQQLVRGESLALSGRTLCPSQRTTYW